MNKMALRLLVGISGLLLVVALAACAPKGTTTTTGSQPSNTATTSSSAVSTPTATATTGNTASTLPSDIPTYPGAKLSSNSAKNGVNTYFYTTPDSMAKVLAFYKQQMPANGWSEQQENGGIANVLEFTKGQQRAVVSVIVPLPTAGSDLTKFSIAVSG